VRGSPEEEKKRMGGGQSLKPSTEQKILICTNRKVAVQPGLADAHKREKRKVRGVSTSTILRGPGPHTERVCPAEDIAGEKEIKSVLKGEAVNKKGVIKSWLQRGADKVPRVVFPVAWD